MPKETDRVPIYEGHTVIYHGEGELETADWFDQGDMSEEEYLAENSCGFGNTMSFLIHWREDPNAFVPDHFKGMVEYAEQWKDRWEDPDCPGIFKDLWKR